MFPPIVGAVPAESEEEEGIWHDEVLGDGWFLREEILSFNQDLIKWWEEVNTAISQYSINITKIKELKTNIEKKSQELRRLEAEFQRWESTVKDEKKFRIFLEQKVKTFNELKDDVSSSLNTETVYPPSNFYHTHLKRQLARYVKFNEVHAKLLSQIEEVDQKDRFINEKGGVGILWPFDSDHPKSTILRVPGAGVMDTVAFRQDERAGSEKMYDDTIEMLKTLKGRIDDSLSRTREELQMFDDMVYDMFTACKDYFERGDDFHLLEEKFKKYHGTIPNLTHNHIFSLILNQILGKATKRKRWWFKKQYNSLSEMTKALRENTGVFKSEMVRSQFQRSCEILNLLNVDGEIPAKFTEVDIDLSNFEVGKPPAAAPVVAGVEAAAAPPAEEAAAARSGKPGISRLLKLAAPSPVAAPSVAAEEGEPLTLPKWRFETILKEKSPEEGDEDIRVIFENFIETPSWASPAAHGTWFSGRYLFEDSLEATENDDFKTELYEEAAPPLEAAPPVAAVEEDAAHPPDPEELALQLGQVFDGNPNLSDPGFFQNTENPTKNSRDLVDLINFIKENMEQRQWGQVSTSLPVVMDLFIWDSRNVEHINLKKVFNQIVWAVNYYAPGGEGSHEYPDQNIQKIDGISFYDEDGVKAMHT